MKNSALARDYIKRAQHRLKAIDTLYTHQDWPDVVRESQEVVELTLKALLRKYNIDAPRIHDVGGILKENVSILSPSLSKQVNLLYEISHELRRDRELSFYGSEDLTPLEFYTEKDASDARNKARKVVEIVLLEFS